MAIIVDKKNGLFHLQTKSSSYIFCTVDSGYLGQLYYGKKVCSESVLGLFYTAVRSSFSPLVSNDVSLDVLPQEVTTYGSGDFRSPMLQFQLEDGSTVTEFKYQGYRIENGKKQLTGLPATYVEKEEEAQTLVVTVKDDYSGLEVELSYSVFETYNAITRSAKILNRSEKERKILRAMSMSLDLPTHDYDWLQLSGSWARERDVVKRPLGLGVQSIESRRGSSGHQQNPFVALLEKSATETTGEVYGFSLVYSGSFLAQAEVEQFSTTRFLMGINPFDFSWQLRSGETFQTPEVVMVYSEKGLGEMSRTYHKLYRERLARGVYRDKTRPVLVNNWEATYFGFTAEKIEKIAEAGSELGIDLFVLDDGWFGHRDNDNSSLGDWFVDKKKLPNGLENLADRVNKLGMQFGLWFEPEMISPDSELYRKHPDWCLHVEGRRRTEGRNQLVLDYTREDVREYIIESISQILSSASIRYVKWDMNRNMTEIGSAILPPEQQREVAHRYMLGLYEVMETITQRFPQVLFESCSGGGGRFDPGMLYYMPQTWTSDNTDAICRLRIQYGTSIVYPISSMGAHVSMVPNHQVGRVTSLQTRGLVAMSGNFGYELDLTTFTEEEKEAVKEQIVLYKEIRELVQFGLQYRLLSPFEGSETSWMFVSQDKKEAAVFYFVELVQAAGPLKRLKLQGLDEKASYRKVGTEEVYAGDILMNLGVPVVNTTGDFYSELIRLEKI